MEISIHIHEDDWGMRNLYPLDSLTEVLGDVQQAAEASIRNRAADGVGWTDVHLISQPSSDYSAAGLRLADAASTLEPLMPRVRRFAATACAGFDSKVRDQLGTYEHDAYCYGFSARCFIKLDPVGDYVKHIWFQCRTTEPRELSALRDAVLAIDALVPSVIADYWNEMAGAIRDPEFFDQYFGQLAQPSK